MNATRLPTLKAIMAENGCDINAARSIRARMEVEADRAHFRKTGEHVLEVVSARDLARHPELAVQDTVRAKLTERKAGDGIANMARLDAIVALAEAASPKLKRRGDRFRRALDERQKRSFAKILAHPGSMDNVKFSEWKPEESLTTPEAQEEFILAAIEDGNPAFVAQSLAVVARARGDQIGSVIWDGIALGLKAAACVPKAVKRTRRRTRRELALA